VAVTREFTGLGGGNQQLAVAQIVWTVTEFPGVQQVRFSIDGQPLEVPTDEGLTDQPVDRDDYRSVAPPSDAN
jgi:spore germination protein GerM